MTKEKLNDIMLKLSKCLGLQPGFKEQLLTAVKKKF